MKSITLSKKVLGASVLAIGLSVLPYSLPASAQTASPTAPALDTTPFQETEDGNNNLGWLGLIGLIGLANLFRKPSRTNSYRETNATTTGTSYRE